VTASDDDRVPAQLAFLLEADRLKGIERRNLVLGGERRENTAEHSWHLALFALVLAEHSDRPVDVGRVIVMLLLHDLVEIDAGDTFAYDVAAHADKHEREQAAADRLFTLLPGTQGAELRAWWDEFEAAETPEARFANAVDRLQPLLLNHAAGGVSWREHGITSDRIRDVNGRIAIGSATLWSAAQRLIDDAVARGLVDE
jgi:putative hydrolases of HD superfamily